MLVNGDDDDKPNILMCDHGKGEEILQTLLPFLAGSRWSLSKLISGALLSNPLLSINALSLGGHGVS